MKKTVKILSLIVVICVLCVSFSGCVSEKDMREQQAYFSGNDIVCDGITYKKLSNVPEKVYPSSDIQELYITKKDVSSLLRQIFVDVDSTYSITNDKNFITTANSNTLYCREDKFDDIQSKIDKNEILYTNDYTCDRWVGDKLLSTPISPDIVKTIEQIISTENEMKTPPKVYDGAKVGITAKLYGNLEKPMIHDLFIYKTENGACIEDDAISLVNCKYYKVPESEVSTFIELIKQLKELDSEESNNILVKEVKL